MHGNYSSDCVLTEMLDFKEPNNLLTGKNPQQQQLSLTVQALYHQDLMPSEASHQMPWDQEYASWI